MLRNRNICLRPIQRKRSNLIDLRIEPSITKKIKQMTLQVTHANKMLFKLLIEKGNLKENKIKN